jgi:hypothetical protein
MKETPPMTRKQALDALFDLHDAYIRLMSYEQYQQQGAFLKQTREALDVFTRAVYGPHDPLEQYGILCERCRRCYGEHFVKEKGKSISTLCCTPCLNALRSEHQLVEGEDA